MADDSEGGIFKETAGSFYPGKRVQARADVGRTSMKDFASEALLAQVRKDFHRSGQRVAFP